jgi:hypothetical protein
MRKSILLPLLLTACAGGETGETYQIIPDFRATAIPVTCEAVDPGPVAVEQLRGATDTSVLVVDAAQRRVTELGDDLRTLWSFEYEEHGPAAVDGPLGAALLGDTAVALLARGGLRLVVLDRQGQLIRARPLGFLPNDIAAHGDQLLVTAVAMGRTPGSLLFRERAGGLDTLPVAPRAYADMLIGALGNQPLVETFPDGAALVVHQFLAPRGFRVHTDGITPLRVPTPDATEARIGYIPQSPVTADQYPNLLLPAMSLSVDRGRREAYLLTRSGRSVDGRLERAILRTDDHLAFRAAYTLDVHAVQMAILPRRGAALVVDDMDRFHLCPLPDADTE